MAHVVASYTNIQPYRRHILLVHRQTNQVRLLSDQRDFASPDSLWHGRCSWRPRCTDFVLSEFHYMGERGNSRHLISFTLDTYSAAMGVWRYTGVERHPRPGLIVEVIFVSALVDHPSVLPLRASPPSNDSGNQSSHSGLALAPGSAVARNSHASRRQDAPQAAGTVAPPGPSPSLVHASVTTAQWALEQFLSCRGASAQAQSSSPQLSGPSGGLVRPGETSNQPLIHNAVRTYPPPVVLPPYTPSPQERLDSSAASPDYEAWLRFMQDMLRFMQEDEGVEDGPHARMEFIP